MLERHLTAARRVASLSLPVAAVLAACAANASAATPSRHPTTHHPHRAALRVTSISPSGNGASGASAVVIRFSQPLAPLARITRRPTITPTLNGGWSQPTPRTLVYRTTSAQVPGAPVTVAVRGSLRDAAGATLGRAVTRTYTVGAGSTTRLEQLLAQLDYLPAHYVGQGSQPGRRDLHAQRRAAFSPPRGRLVLGSGWPSALHGLFTGDAAVVLRGALMAFQSQHGLAMTGVADETTWSALLSARLGGALNRGGYTYALASESQPESLTIYHDGRVAASTPANTGIPASPTATGTFPVYERLRAQTMRGTNPDGSSYADPVQFVAYFNGGDAVHYMPRGAYGSPQSLGCVEIPYAAAARIWPYLTYGTLVTVAP